MGWDNLGWDWDSKIIISMRWDGTGTNISEKGWDWDDYLWDKMGSHGICASQRNIISNRLIQYVGYDSKTLKNSHFYGLRHRGISLSLMASNISCYVLS